MKPPLRDCVPNLTWDLLTLQTFTYRPQARRTRHQAKEDHHHHTEQDQAQKLVGFSGPNGEVACAEGRASGTAEGRKEG